MLKIINYNFYKKLFKYLINPKLITRFCISKIKTYLKDLVLCYVYYKFKFYFRNASNFEFVKLKSLNIPWTRGSKDKQELLYYRYGEKWYQNEKQRLKPWVSKGMLTVDVGANIGIISTLLSKLTGISGKVYSFEPSKEVFGKLQRTIEYNKLRNVKVFQLACGDTLDSLFLRNTTLYSGLASIHVNPKSSKFSEEKISSTSLDEFFKNERIDFLKIDTEGNEALVLRGANKILKRDKPIVYIELCNQYRASSEESIKILKDHGYTFNVEPDLNLASNGDNFIAYSK